MKYVLLLALLIGCQSKQKTQISYDEIESSGLLIEAKFDSPPNILYQEPLNYPQGARSANIEGAVKIWFIVDTNGRAKQIKVLESTNDIFNETSIEFVKKIKFKPAMYKKRPVEMSVVKDIVFRLK